LIDKRPSSVQSLQTKGMASAVPYTKQNRMAFRPRGTPFVTFPAEPHEKNSLRAFDPELAGSTEKRIVRRAPQADITSAGTVKEDEWRAR
jgi:hypothetical protein